MRSRLFQVTLADLREEHFRGSGSGGQKRNKTDSGVRFTHEPSGASAECEAERSQLQNRKEALRKLARHPRFVAWARAEAAARLEGYAGVERKGDAMMREGNLRIEVGAAECAPGEVYCDAKDA